MNMLNNVSLFLNNLTYDDHLGDGVCQDSNVLKGIKIAGLLLRVATFAVPLIIIAIGSINMFKAVTSNKNDELITQGKKLFFKIFIGVLVFFLPNIIHSVLEMTDLMPDEYKDCETCLIDIENCNP